MMLPGIANRRGYCPSPGDALDVPTLLGTDSNTYLKGFNESEVLTGSVGTNFSNCSSGSGSIPLDRTDFEVLELLGSGAFGEVKLVRYNVDKQLYAMKVIEKITLHERNRNHAALDHAQAERDICVMAQAWHCPFIIGLFATFQTNEKLYYIFEHCPGGDLKGLMDAQPQFHFSERAAHFYLAEVTFALAHIHSHDVIHRDVKLENVLVDAGGHIKLADFGLAKDCADSQCAGAAGSMGSQCDFNILMPPEFLRKDKCGKEMDCWQLGVMAFVMLSGRWPQRSADPSEWPGVLPDEVSPAMRELCCGLLQEDPTERLGYPDGAGLVCSHAVFESTDWNMLEKKVLQPPFQAQECHGLPMRGSLRNGVRDLMKMSRFSFTRKSVMGRLTSKMRRTYAKLMLD